jgi:Tol biopolymer transport system component
MIAPARVVVFFVLAAAAALAAAPQQQPATAAALFQRGLLLERAEGSLSQAMVLFERVIAEYPEDRAVVPQALRHLAMAYERQSDPRAARLWQRLATDYAASPLAAEARERIAQEAGPFRMRPYEVSPDDRFVRMSPTGRSVAYVRDDRGGDRLFIRDIEPARDREVFRIAGRALENPQWSPDGQQLAFVTLPRVNGRVNLQDHHDVHVWNSATGQTRTVAEVRSGYSTGEWSPNSQWLAVHFGWNPSSPAGALRFVNAATGATRDVLAASTAGTGLAWSPDSRELAFRTTDAARRDEFWIADVASGQRRPLSMSLAASEGRLHLATGLGVGSAWKTNGQILVGQVSPGDSSDLYLVPTSGGTARKACSFQVGSARCLPMTPDGRAQLILDPGGNRLSVLDIASGRERRLTSWFAEERSAEMSPDGRLAVFRSNWDGRWALYVMPIDETAGVNPVRLAELPGRPTATSTSWSADGRLLARVGYNEDIVARVNVDANARATSGVGRLTHDTFESIMPAISPRGDQIAYWYEKGIAVMTADGGAERPLLPLNFTGHLQWRGDNDLLFQRQAAAGRTTIASVNVMTGAVQPFVDLPSGPGYAWQFVPSRNEVVYVTADAAGSTHTLRARSLAGASERVIATVRDMLTFRYTFRVSRDGRFVAYGRWTGANADRRPELRVMTIDGRDDRVVPTSTAPTGNWRPSGFPYDWSPDGRFVLIDQYPGQLTAVDVRTGASHPIDGIVDTDFGEWAGAQWAPDGSFVVASGGAGRSQYQLFEGVTYDAVMKLARQR